MSVRANALLAALIVVKVAITAWNAHVYHGAQYDTGHHASRVITGGLEMSPLAYNPALYYLPALLTRHWHGVPVEQVDGHALLKDLRYINAIYAAGFYVLWVFVLFPALTSPGNAIVASLMLLALPGYQKLAMMAHPDNLVPVTSAAALALWVHGRKRLPRSWPSLILLAISIGLIGLSRPFAAGTVAALAAFAFFDELPGWRAQPLRTLARAAALLGLVGSISLSWYVYRYQSTGHMGGAYKQAYIDRYAVHRQDFDFVHFFGTFYPEALWQRPNRYIYVLDTDNPPPRNRYTNSFWTLLYSDVWGDQLLYVSGPTKQERKLWVKRVVLTLALPSVILLAIGWSRSLWAAYSAGLRRVLERREVLAVAAMFTLGAALYLYWATGTGLLPGKGSTIKFIYVAHLFPLAIALALLVPLTRRMQRALSAYALGLFLVALPMAAFSLGQSEQSEEAPKKVVHYSQLARSQ